MRGCFARDTSSSTAARLRLLFDSNIYGSIFSESESSGDGARLFRLGAELGVIASRLLVFVVYRHRPKHTILSVLDALQAPQLRFIEDAEGLSSWG